MKEIHKIPGYRLERELGHGGMADVYLAVQENLDRHVAIKVLAPELLRDENFAKRFIKEAQTAAKLSHPNITTIHDVGHAGGSYFIVMEYLPGGSLKERIRRGALQPDEALGIVRQVASALQYAHEKGYIHRDIKPDNIMFRADGTAVLTDFGIARAVDSRTKLTKTGMSIGTPHYMSPEQARSKQLDGRSDLYSLGIVLYEMLTGMVPYDGEDSVAIAIQHIQEPVPVLPVLLARQQPLLEKLLAKDPQERVQSGKDLINLLGNPLDIKIERITSIDLADGISLDRKDDGARWAQKNSDKNDDPNNANRLGNITEKRLASPEELFELIQGGHKGIQPVRSYTEIDSLLEQYDEDNRKVRPWPVVIGALMILIALLIHSLSVAIIPFILGMASVAFGVGYLFGYSQLIANKISEFLD